MYMNIDKLSLAMLSFCAKDVNKLETIEISHTLLDVEEFIW